MIIDLLDILLVPTEDSFHPTPFRVRLSTFPANVCISEIISLWRTFLIPTMVATQRLPAEGNVWAFMFLPVGMLPKGALQLSPTAVLPVPGFIVVLTIHTDPTFPIKIESSITTTLPTGDAEHGGGGMLLGSGGRRTAVLRISPKLHHCPSLKGGESHLILKGGN